MASHKIYLGNINKSVNQSKLKEHFSSCGEVSEVLLPMDKKTKEVKGYAFVSFTDEASVQEALKQDGTEVFGQEITVQVAVEKTSGNA